MKSFGGGILLVVAVVVQAQEEVVEVILVPPHGKLVDNCNERKRYSKFGQICN